jgi:hypothetical protein
MTNRIVRHRLSLDGGTHHLEAQAWRLRRQSFSSSRGCSRPQWYTPQKGRLGRV